LKLEEQLKLEKQLKSKVII